MTTSASLGRGVRRIRPLHLGILVLVALLALSVVGYLRARAELDDNGKIDRARESALTSAKRYAVDFSTYEYTTLDATFKKVANELTGDFKTQYEATAASLKATLQKYKGKAVATVQAAAVEKVSTDRATVIVLLDQVVTSTSSPTPRIDRSRLVITLVRAKGGWLMSGLDLK